jgi:hypothetical protein
MNLTVLLLASVQPLLADLFEFRADPMETIGILSTEEWEISEPNLQTCIEGATEQSKIEQKLIIEDHPSKEFKKKRHCSGHDAEVTYDSKEKIWFKTRSTVEKFKSKMETQFQDRDPYFKGLERCDFKIDDSQAKEWGLYSLKVEYRHPDDSPDCTLSTYIEVDPPENEEMMTKNVIHCMGHHMTKITKDKNGKKLKSYAMAKKTMEAKCNQFKEDSTIEAYDLHLHQYAHEDAQNWAVVGAYRHLDDHVPDTCTSKFVETVYYTPAIHTERWEGPDGSDLEKDPHCTLIKIENIDPITRNLIIARDPIDSPCAKFREHGGFLLKKVCLDEDGGRCISWKKTYDLEKISPYIKRRHTFQEGLPLYGFNGEFDDAKKYDKKSELPSIGALLSSAASLSSLDSKDAYPGAVQTCRCSFKDGIDCCNNNLSSPGEPCNVNERQLTHAIRDGRCHFIGAFDGSKTYCCFASKTARILQEHAREKLNIDWGTVLQPNCRGLTQTEFQALAKDQNVDLSEAYEPFNAERTMKMVKEKLQSMASQ